MKPRQPRKLISTTTLHRLILDLNGATEPTETNVATMPTPHSSPLGSPADVALVVGGGGDPLSEYGAARAMCEAAQKSVQTFVCNDTLMIFPDVVDHAGTLHPDKMPGWIRGRTERGLPMPFGRTWAHRDYVGFSNSTRDWQGSSGLFMTKVALETGHSHIILCGIPMTPEAEHIIRHKPWGAAQGFIRGWNRRIGTLMPYVRSMSGWTQEKFGAPTFMWLITDIPRGGFRPERPPGRA